MSFRVSPGNMAAKMIYFTWGDPCFYWHEQQQHLQVQRRRIYWTNFCDEFIYLPCTTVDTCDCHAIANKWRQGSRLILSLFRLSCIKESSSVTRTSEKLQRIVNICAPCMGYTIVVPRTMILATLLWVVFPELSIWTFRNHITLYYVSCSELIRIVYISHVGTI